ncbi:hypothetical protein TNCV_5062981 [Trichonephila clavipes]|nr:hypothetical protein TNCV_5062981 [Trichonephila clavipes]
MRYEVILLQENLVITLNAQSTFHQTKWGKKENPALRICSSLKRVIKKIFSQFGEESPSPVQRLIQPKKTWL